MSLSKTYGMLLEEGAPRRRLLILYWLAVAWLVELAVAGSPELLQLLPDLSLTEEAWHSHSLQAPLNKKSNALD